MKELWHREEKDLKGQSQDLIHRARKLQSASSAQTIRLPSSGKNPKGAGEGMIK